MQKFSSFNEQRRNITTQTSGNFPGKVEPQDATVLDAAARECLEENGFNNHGIYHGGKKF